MELIGTCCGLIKRHPANNYKKMESQYANDSEHQGCLSGNEPKPCHGVSVDQIRGVSKAGEYHRGSCGLARACCTGLDTTNGYAVVFRAVNRPPFLLPVVPVWERGGDVVIGAANRFAA